MNNKKYPAINRIQSTWRQLTAPSVNDPDEKIREHMTRVVLLMQGSALAVFTLPVIVGWIVGAFPLEAALIMFLLLVPTITGFWLVNRGWWHIASFIPPILFFAVGLYFSFHIPLGMTPILFFILASILASILQGSRVFWIISGFSLTAYFALSAFRSQESIQMVIEAMIISGGAFTGITLLQWFSTSQFRKSIQNLNSEINKRKKIEDEKDLLLEQVQGANERLRGLSRELITSQEMERMHIAGELHEGLGQALTEISLDLGIIARDLQPETARDSGQRLAEVRDMAGELDKRIWDLALDLRPFMLDHLGLIPTLKWYLNKFSQRTEVDVEMELINLEKRLPSEIETALYRIIQEALAKAAKPAGVNKVKLLLEQRQKTVLVTIEDEAQGFDVEEFQSTNVPLNSEGLVGMKDRISLLGGRLVIHSNPGKGNRMEI
ncbi:MAG: sensor histidine kinase, partial [Desulfobacteraceae bacterium]|nr:sensor histidine kinase [Desulfobacteraceae bacterium]